MIVFIRGVLSKKEGKEVNFYKALNFSLSFLNKKILDIPEEKISETIHEINKVNELVNRRPEKINLNLSREQVIQTLNIPSEYYIGRGYLPETLVAFDVGECYNSSKQMHNRAVVPIYDIDGSYAGCTGRALNDETKPKWFNSKGFKKALYLYGVSVTMPYIKQTNTVVLVEGQGDVWRLYEAGIKNCAGIFGSDLSEDQLVALEEMEIFNIVILTDTDEAGEKAAEGIKNKGGRRFNYYRPKISKKDIGEMTIEEINTELKPQIKGLF
jgi:5S rRNA maturation endonuclease (ribonuclease M5)